MTLRPAQKMRGAVNVPLLSQWRAIERDTSLPAPTFLHRACSSPISAPGLKVTQPSFSPAIDKPFELSVDYY